MCLDMTCFYITLDIYQKGANKLVTLSLTTPDIRCCFETWHYTV